MREAFCETELCDVVVDDDDCEDEEEDEAVLACTMS